MPAIKIKIHPAFLILLPHFLSKTVLMKTGLNPFIDIYRVVSVVLACYLLIKEGKKVSPALLILTVMESWMLFSTLVNNPSKIFLAVTTVASALTVSIVVELYADRIQLLLPALMVLYELLIYGNFIYTVLYNNTVDCYFLIGNYNTFSVVYFPALLIGLLYLEYESKIVRPSLLIAISSYLILVGRSTTTMVALLFLVAVGMLYRMGFFKQSFAKYIAGTILFLNVFFVFYYVGNKYQFIDRIITEYMGKTLTFSGRDAIWKAAINLFCEKPVLGYGYECGVRYSEYGIAAHAHNELLQRLVVGGGPYCLLFIILNVLIIKKVSKADSSRVNSIITSVYLGTLLLFLTEAYIELWRVYVVLFFAYNVNSINKQCKTKKEYP